jgi:excisionase family DNA binding protein
MSRQQVRFIMPSASVKTESLSNNNPTERKPPQSESFPWRQALNERSSPPISPPPVVPFLSQERLLNAREVAARLGVSERWVRDHTTRRFPKLRGVKLGTLMRYRSADVEEFMEKLTTSRSSMQARFGG